MKTELWDLEHLLENKNIEQELLLQQNREIEDKIIDAGKQLEQLHHSNENQLLERLKLAQRKLEDQIKEDKDRRIAMEELIIVVDRSQRLFNLESKDGMDLQKLLLQRKIRRESFKKKKNGEALVLHQNRKDGNDSSKNIFENDRTMIVRRILPHQQLIANQAVEILTTNESAKTIYKPGSGSVIGADAGTGSPMLNVSVDRPFNSGTSNNIYSNINGVLHRPGLSTSLSSSNRRRDDNNIGFDFSENFGLKIAVMQLSEILEALNSLTIINEEGYFPPLIYFIFSSISLFFHVYFLFFYPRFYQILYFYLR